VNLVVGIGLVALLAVDYRHELSERLEAKRGSLAEEARTILPAVRMLRARGTDAVQSHIDDVCSRMRQAQSPRHHIAVRLGDRMLQAQGHQFASERLLQDIEAAADSTRPVLTDDGVPLVTGFERQGDLAVYVSESVAQVRRHVRADVAGRALAIVIGGVVIVVIVNVLLLRLVTRPLGNLVSVVRRIADGELGIRPGRFRSAELDFLGAEIGQMSVSMARTSRDRRAQLAKARKIQEHLRPDPPVASEIDVASLYQPADTVAGDYYDIIRLDDGSWILAIADVCGHGVPAAMVAATLKTLLLSAIETTHDPGQMLRIINERFFRVTLAEDFASILIVRIMPSRMQIQYAGAGHEPGYVLSADGGIEPLASTGMLAGVLAHGDWATRSLPIGPDDRLVLVTDGVTESMDPRNQQFGRERLVRMLRDASDLRPDELVPRLGRGIEAHRRTAPVLDDITILVVALCGAREHQPAGTREQTSAPS